MRRGNTELLQVNDVRNFYTNSPMCMAINVWSSKAPPVRVGRIATVEPDRQWPDRRRTQTGHKESVAARSKIAPYRSFGRDLVRDDESQARTLVEPGMFTPDLRQWVNAGIGPSRHCHGRMRGTTFLRAHGVQS